MRTLFLSDSTSSLNALYCLHMCMCTRYKAFSRRNHFIHTISLFALVSLDVSRETIRRESFTTGFKICAIRATLRGNALSWHIYILRAQRRFIKILILRVFRVFNTVHIGAESKCEKVSYFLQYIQGSLLIESFSGYSRLNHSIYIFSLNYILPSFFFF